MPGDPTEKITLFALHPARDPTPAHLLADATRQKLVGFYLDLFELSPDQTRIALVSEKARVAVMTLATGALQTVQDREAETAHTLPTWRTKLELTYMAPKDKQQSHIVCQDLAGKTQQVLSATWPNDITNGWLAKGKEGGKPEAQQKRADPDEKD